NLRKRRQFGLRKNALKVGALPQARVRRTMDLSRSALRKLASRLRPAAVRSLPSRYESYAAALRACDSAGYQDEQLVGVVFRKSSRYRDRLASGFPVQIGVSGAQTLLAVALASSGGNTPVRVVDFGGACGVHYFATRAFFGSSVRILW